MALFAANSRALMQTAQAKALEIRSLEKGSTTSAEAFCGILALAGMVNKVRESIACITDETQKSIWTQRSTWLQEELVAIASELLQGEHFWDNVAGLLYSGASIIEKARAQTDRLAEELTAARSQLEAAEARAEKAEKQSQNTHTKQRRGGGTESSGADENEGEREGEGAGRRGSESRQGGLQGEAATSTQDSKTTGATAASSGAPALLPRSCQHDPVEMRTKLVLQQQDLQRRVQDNRELVLRLEKVLKERDQLQKERGELAEECQRQKHAFESQAVVIRQLMEQSEGLTRESQKISTEQESIIADNHAMKHSLQQHADVVEKLINLNAELMDAANHAAILLERGHSQTASMKSESDPCSPSSMNSKLAHTRSSGGVITPMPVSVPPKILGDTSPVNMSSSVAKQVEGAEQDIGDDMKIFLQSGMRKALSLASYISGSEPELETTDPVEEMNRMSNMEAAFEEVTEKKESMTLGKVFGNW